MAKFSFHCQNYKASQICAIDKHNRRLNKHYHSNPDIDTGKSANNRIYVAPKETLFKDCKNLIEKLYYNSNISLDRKAIKSKELINL